MTYPCPCQELSNDCWRICPLYRDWQNREGLGSPFADHARENHPWRDEAHYESLTEYQRDHGGHYY
jgi:hypothetical protein